MCPPVVQGSKKPNSNRVKETYPTTPVIIDAAEIFRTKSESYSYYKHHNTATGVIGSAPSGL